MPNDNIVLPLPSNNASLSDNANEEVGGKPFVENVNLGTELSPEELAAQEAAKAQEDEDAKAAEEAKKALEEEAAAKAAADLKGEPEVKLDENGKPIVTGEPEVVEVEIEGQNYTLDANGNAINAQGETVYTKEALAGMEEISDNEQAAFELAELSNIQPVDSEGKIIEYEATPEGKRKYIEDVYNAGGIDRAEKIIQQRYAANPLLKTVSDYIIANGSLDGFTEDSFVRTPITKDSTDDEMVAAIRQARTMKGDSEIEIANIISWAKSDNKLKDLATTSDAYLAAHENEERQALELRAKEVEEERIGRTREYVDNIITTVSQGVIQIGDEQLVIPAILEINTPDGKRVAQRDELIAYGTEVNQYRMPDGSIQNATQYQIDKWVKNNNRNINDDVFEMVNLFTGGNNSQLIKQAVAHNQSQTIKKRFKLKGSATPNASNTKGKIKLKYSK